MNKNAVSGHFELRDRERRSTLWSGATDRQAISSMRDDDCYFGHKERVRDGVAALSQLPFASVVHLTGAEHIGRIGVPPDHVSVVAAAILSAVSIHASAPHQSRQAGV